MQIPPVIQTHYDNLPLTTQQRLKSISDVKIDPMKITQGYLGWPIFGLIVGICAALAVGLTVGFCAMMGGPLTGASMNPARSLGPAIVGQVWTDHWIYWLAPISAALVAVRLYEFLRPVSPLQIGEMLGVEGPIQR